MNHHDFITFVKQPEKLTSDFISDLREITELYPAFVQARVLYTRAFQQSDSVGFEANLKLTTLYSTNRWKLFYFLQPDKKLAVEPYRKQRNGKSHGDYFDMIDAIEQDGADPKQSLKNLAERLKSARALVTEPAAVKSPVVHSKIINTTINLEVAYENNDDEISENRAKNLIREKKYIEAIEILRKLNLNNPKKSVYFADQIRFLEKVIVNSKK